MVRRITAPLLISTIAIKFSTMIKWRILSLKMEKTMMIFNWQIKKAERKTKEKKERMMTHSSTKETV